MNTMKFRPAWSTLMRMTAAITLAATFALGSTMRPASADQAASTRNTIIGAALLVAGIATAANVSHKNAVANTVEGYTPDGGTVYQDGHVAYANGQTYYPGSAGQSIDCNGQACAVSGNGYNGSGYNGSGYNGNGYTGYNGGNRNRRYGGYAFRR